MSIVQDIVRTYVAPREVFRRRVSGPPREDRALAVLMSGCLLMFVAQLPQAARLAWEDPSIPFEARLAGALQGWLIMMPLAAYVIAALVQVPFRLIAGRGSWFGGRLALFWAILASAPLWLLNGLVAGFMGPGPAMNMTGTLSVVALVVFWGAGLYVNQSETESRA